MDRVNISVAIIPMAAELGWDKSTQGYVLSRFFIGYLATQILGGRLSDRFGGKVADDNPLALQDSIASGQVAFVDSPYMMLLILAAAALIGVLIAIAFKRAFTTQGSLASVDLVPSRTSR